MHNYNTHTLVFTAFLPNSTRNDIMAQIPDDDELHMLLQDPEAAPALIAFLRARQLPPPPEKRLTDACTAMWAAIAAAPTSAMATQVAVTALGWPQRTPGRDLGVSDVLAAFLCLPPTATTDSRSFQGTLASIQEAVNGDNPHLSAALLRGHACLFPAASGTASPVAADALLCILRSAAKRVARPLLFAVWDAWSSTHGHNGRIAVDELDRQLVMLGHPHFVVVTANAARPTDKRPRDPREEERVIPAPHHMNQQLRRH